MRYCSRETTSSSRVGNPPVAIEMHYSTNQVALKKAT
jgi:hypothetical protein